MPESDQDHGRVADPMPVVPRSLDQFFNLELGEVLPRPQVFVLAVEVELPVILIRWKLLTRAKRLRRSFPAKIMSYAGIFLH